MVSRAKVKKSSPEEFLGARWRFATVAVSLAFLVGGCSQRPAAEQLADARVELEKGDRGAAVVLLKSALQSQPDLLDARVLLGQALFASGDMNGAAIELQKARASGYPGDEIVPTIAISLLLGGKIDRLLADFSDVELKDRRQLAELKSVLATALGIKGRVQAANDLATESLRLDPANLSAKLVLVRGQASNGDVEGALKQLEALLPENEKLSPPWLLKAELMSYLGRPPADLLEAYRHVLKIDSKNISAMGAMVSLLSQTGEKDAAERQLQRMKEAYPRHPLTVFQGALLASQQGKLDQANEQIQALLKLTPDDSRARHLAGAVAYQRGSFVQAAQHLTKAVADGEANIAARALLARTYLRLGEPGRALISLRPLLEMRMVPADVHVIAAEAQLQQGDVNAAKLLFEKALARQPDDQRARTALILARATDGQGDLSDAALRQVGASDSGAMGEMALVALRISRKQWQEALVAIDALEKKQPSGPLAQTLRGRVESLRGDLTKARAHFEAAQALNPNYMPAVSALAALDLRDGKQDAAVARYQKLAESEGGRVEADMAIIALRTEARAKPEELMSLITQAIKRHPGEPQPRLALIQAHLANGKTKEALAAAQEGVAAFPNEPAFHDAETRVLQRLGDVNSALAAATKMASLRSTSPVPLMRMAELEASRGDAEASIAHLQRALSLRADFLPAQQALANLLIAKLRDKEARAVALQVQKQRPDDPSGWVLAGDVETAMKQHAQAATAYRAAMQRGGGSEVAVKLHAVLLSGNALEAMRGFEKSYLADHPEDAMFRVYLAERALRSKDYVRAEEGFREALRVRSDNPAALNNLALAQFEMGKSEALETIERAHRLAPTFGPILDTMATILAGRGRLEDALLRQREAVKADPAASHQLQLAQLLFKAGRKAEARPVLVELEKLGAQFERQDEVKSLLGQL